MGIVCKLYRIVLEYGNIWFSTEGHLWIDVLGQEQSSYSFLSKEFNEWLTGEYERQYQSYVNLSTETIRRLIHRLSSFKGKLPIYPVFRRIGEHKNKLFIDLRNETHQVVEVSDTGWKVINYKNCPVRFIRSQSQNYQLQRIMILKPEKEKKLNELKRFLQVSEIAFSYIIDWLCLSFIPTGKKPILVIKGDEQRNKILAFLKRLIDPFSLILTKIPPTRELMKIAYNEWVLGYEVSSLSKSQYRAVYQLATGNNKYGYIRPQIIATENWHSDEFLSAHSWVISVEQMRTEREGVNLETEFIRTRGYFLGALLDRLVEELKNYKNLVEMSDYYLQRMWKQKINQLEKIFIETDEMHCQTL